MNKSNLFEESNRMAWRRCMHTRLRDRQRLIIRQGSDQCSSLFVRWFSGFKLSCLDSWLTLLMHKSCRRIPKTYNSGRKTWTKFAMDCTTIRMPITIECLNSSEASPYKSLRWYSSFGENASVFYFSMKSSFRMDSTSRTINQRQWLSKFW